MKSELSSMLYALVEASNYAVLPPTVVAVVRWSRLGAAQHFFARALLLIATIQLAAVVAIHHDVMNMPLYHLYLLVEAPALLWLYCFRLQGNPVAKVLPWAAGGFVLVLLVNIALQKSWGDLPSIPRTIEGVLMCVLALVYFRHVFQERKVKYLAKSFWFWLSSGLFLYFSGNLMLFMFTNLLLPLEDELFYGAWAIHGVLNFMLYAVYSIALLCRDRTSSSSSL